MSLKPNNIFILVKFMKKDWKDIGGGRCMSCKDEKLGFSEKVRNIIRKNYIKEIKSNENNWDHMTEAGIVEGPIKKFT